MITCTQILAWLPMDTKVLLPPNLIKNLDKKNEGGGGGEAKDSICRQFYSQFDIIESKQNLYCPHKS